MVIKKILDTNNINKENTILKYSLFALLLTSKFDKFKNFKLPV